MFSSQHNFDPNRNSQEYFFSQVGARDNNSAFFQNQISNQSLFQCPPNFSENRSTFSTNYAKSEASTNNSSISQMTSLYLANQRKKAFTDEIYFCLNKCLEKILPEIAKQTAEIIYKSLSETIQASLNNIQLLRNEIDILRSTLKSLPFLTKRGAGMNTIKNIYSQLRNVSGNLNNCGMLLNNQIKFAEGNEEYKNQQQEIINNIANKLEQIKELLGKQKEFSTKLNDNIKQSLVNIISTKTDYKNELIKIQDQIKYNIVNEETNNNNLNLENQINNISTSINDFKNKVDSASNIFPNNNVSGNNDNTNLNNINNSNNNDVNNSENINNDQNQNEKNESNCCTQNNNKIGNNNIGRFLSQIDNGAFSF